MAQISLRIRAVWSGPSLTANTILDTTESMNGEHRSGWYFEDYLNCISRMFESIFWHDKAYVVIHFVFRRSVARDSGVTCKIFRVITTSRSTLCINMSCFRKKFVHFIIAPAKNKTYNKTCTTSKNSDQPVQPRSLSRVFADRMCLQQLSGFPKEMNENPRFLVGCTGWSESLLVTQVLHVL